MGVNSKEVLFTRNYIKCPEVYKKVMLINPPQKWAWVQFTKEICQGFMKCPDLHSKLIFATPPLTAVPTKNIFGT